ncbi:MAG: hypothetical protein AB7J86_10095 [Vulcanimicrobiota bacterium]
MLSLLLGLTAWIGKDTMPSMASRYRAFELEITSEFPLPAAPGSGDLEADVTIVAGRVPGSLRFPSDTGLLFQAAPDEFLLSVAGIARYYVEAGHQITVEPAAGAKADAVEVFLSGSAMGALLHQRGLLALHASAVALRDMAVVFAGPSGAGKSTLVSTLIGRGYEILCDDICVLRQDLVLPGYTRLRLWKDSLEGLGLQPGRRIREGIEKFEFDHSGRAGSLPCRQLFLLGSGEAVIEPGSRLQHLIRNTYRRRYLRGLGRQEQHFQACARLAGRLPMAWLERGRVFGQLPGLLEEWTGAARG